MQQSRLRRRPLTAGARRARLEKLNELLAKTLDQARAIAPESSARRRRNKGADVFRPRSASST
jgi:hypothetical protein